MTDTNMGAQLNETRADRVFAHETRSQPWRQTLFSAISCPTTACILAMLTAWCLSPRLYAQDLEPRTYVNLPVGQNFLGLVYAYSDGEITPAPSVPVRDIELTMNVMGLAYMRSLDLAGKAGSLTASWARICQDGEGFINGERRTGDRCGTSDPTLRLAYMFYGAPAQDMATFRKQPSQRVIGASLQVAAPVGDYNNENLINTGSNRWTFKPEIGVSNAWGRWSGDAAFAARIFTDNDKFNGDRKLEQDPLYQLQAHLIYTFPRGRWLSLNGNYYWGGRTKQNGVRLDDEQDNSRIGLTLAWPLTPQFSLKLYANRGLVTNLGSDFETVGAALQYRWGD